MSNQVEPSAPLSRSLKLRRASDGVIAGVCAGIARRLDVEPWLVRFVWAMAVLCGGVGTLLYIVFWICMPRIDAPDDGLRRIIFGVCARIGRRGDVDIAIARLLAVLIFILSGGIAVVGYILLYFLLPDAQLNSRPSASSASSESAPL